MYNKPLILTLLSFTIMACGDEAPKSTQPVEPKVEVSTHQPIRLSPKMVSITGSQFSMGSVNGQRDENMHPVDLSGHKYWVSETEVTQELYEIVMGDNPSKRKNSTNPVERVSWRDAVQFCNKLSEMEKLMPVYTINDNEVLWNGKADGYRLLTEAEWEFAARGGVDTLYAGSERADEVAWTAGNSKKKTHPVKQKAPNGFGLYDMSGNIYEWVWDWHPCGTLAFDTLKNCDGEYATTTTTLPTGPLSGSEKVFRGGSYKQKKSSARVTNRGFYITTAKQSNVGFRVARNQTNDFPQKIVSKEVPSTIAVDFLFEGIEEGCSRNSDLGKLLSLLTLSYGGPKKITLSSSKLSKLFGKVQIENTCEDEYALLNVPFKNATFMEFPAVKLRRYHGCDNGIDGFQFVVKGPFNQVKRTFLNKYRIRERILLDEGVTYKLDISETKDGNALFTCDTSM